MSEYCKDHIIFQNIKFKKDTERQIYISKYDNSDNIRILVYIDSNNSNQPYECGEKIIQEINKIKDNLISKSNINFGYYVSNFELYDNGILYLQYNHGDVRLKIDIDKYRELYNKNIDKDLLEKYENQW